METVEELEEIIAVPSKKSKKITKHSSEKKGAERCVLILLLPGGSGSGSGGGGGGKGALSYIIQSGSYTLG